MRERKHEVTVTAWREAHPDDKLCICQHAMGVPPCCPAGRRSVCMIQIVSRVTVVKVRRTAARLFIHLEAAVQAWQPDQQDFTRSKGRSPPDAGATHKYVRMLQCRIHRWGAHHLL